MKVSELIEVLQKMPQDLPVVVYDNEPGWAEVHHVDVGSNSYVAKVDYTTPSRTTTTTHAMRRVVSVMSRRDS